LSELHSSRIVQVLTLGVEPMRITAKNNHIEELRRRRRGGGLD
jgi:hypothetical protein